MSCPFTEDDAAFVLGALDPPAMRAFEAHLPGCEECRTSVEELRVLPGLLARLLPGAAAAGAGRVRPATDHPDALPVLLGRVRSERRRTRLRTFAASAAAAVLAAAAGAAIALGTGEEATTLPQAQTATELRMSASPGVPVRATLFLTGRGWGTSIDTRCRYPEGDRPGPQDPVLETIGYGLYAVEQDGAVVLVSSWRHRRGTEIVIPGSTGLDLADIARLEVRDDSGFVVLSASP